MIGSDLKEITIKLPSIQGKEKTVSEIIIALLTQEWPLSMKGMQNRIKRKYGLEVSLQAVHKATRKLQTEQILARTNNYYKINPDWLNKIHKFSSTVRKQYSKKDANLEGLP